MMSFAVIATLLVGLFVVDRWRGGPERRAAKRLRKLFRADLHPGIPVIRAMPRRKK